MSIRWSSVESLLRSLNAQGITILLVSHDMKLMTVASTVHVLCFGEIIASGSFDDIKASPKVREAYLGVGGDRAYSRSKTSRQATARSPCCAASASRSAGRKAYESRPCPGP